MTWAEGGFGGFGAGVGAVVLLARSLAGLGGTIRLCVFLVSG
jgi:hypothetical protein